MVRRWIGRVFEQGFALARLGVLLACMVGDLLFLHAPASPFDWALALCALAVSVAVRWSPLGVVVTLVAFIGVADLYHSNAVISLKVLTCVTLFEVTMRGSRRQIALGAGALAAVVCFNVFDTLPAALPSVLFRVAVMVGVPLLLGSYIRLLHETAVRDRERAEERLRVARAAERTVIARELHDLVAHHVSSMVLRVGVARHVLPGDDPRVGELLDDLHSCGTAAMADLRKLVSVLRDPAKVGDDPGTSFVEPQGLPAALETVVERGRATGMRVDSSVDAAVGGLDAVRGITVLRLVQEGLANAARHAGPRARVRLAVTVGGDGAVRLTIEDDGGSAPPAGRGATAGRGPSAPNGSAGGGHGLAGMRERVAILGGSLEAGPAGSGWRLSARLPVSPPVTMELVA
ncbi:sensor histidine kinase [Sphaerisporangium fuscum]|uniref:sensor histidine kinase n=1 Tax=Sphaerisporangium fuscum TaxID=2835868 RepID=UPI001BDC8B54|nr:histidine kinase [Sphaerisporangium fuscum]